MVPNGRALLLRRIRAPQGRPPRRHGPGAASTPCCCSSRRSMYWLTGYDTFGFCFFQCLVVTADGRMALLTRSADLRQAQPHLEHRRTSASGRMPPTPTRRGTCSALAADLGLAGKRLGVEYESYGLVAANGKKLEAAFDGFATLADASQLVTRLRAVKSRGGDRLCPQGAAALANAADRAALAADPGGRRRGRHPGRPARRDLQRRRRLSGQRVHHRLRRATRFCAATSPAAAGSTTRDQITLEFAGAYRHYHAAIMRTVVVGEPRPRHLAYHRAAREALLACEAEIRPGRTAGDVFAAHARVLDAHGLSPAPAQRLRLLARAPSSRRPGWTGRCSTRAIPGPIEPGMVLFAHMILMDSRRDGTAMPRAHLSRVRKPARRP